LAYDIYTVPDVVKLHSDPALDVTTAANQLMELTYGTVYRRGTLAAIRGLSLRAINPATGESVARIAHGGPAEIDAAVAAATEAQRVWAAMDGSRRADLIWAWTEAFLARTEQIGLADVRAPLSRKARPIWANP
jgi:hypothetical protein